MSEPTPAEIEATAPETVDVEYGGQTYNFPSSFEDCDGDVLEAVDNEKFSHALMALMSDDDWARFKKTKPRVKDYPGLFDAYFTKIGLGSAGE